MIMTAALALAQTVPATPAPAVETKAGDAKGKGKAADTKGGEKGKAADTKGGEKGKAADTKGGEKGKAAEKGK